MNAGKMDKIYDSDIASDVGEMMDLDSDHEPPKDVICERRLLRKEKFMRVYKEILQIGYQLDKPAKYDEVSVRLLEKADENREIEDVKAVKAQKMNLGLQNIGEWVDEYVTTMKRNEIALFVVEYLKESDISTKALDRKECTKIHLIEWQTVTDMDGDLNYMKRLIQKGERLDRCIHWDEITVNISIHQDGQELWSRDVEKPEVMPARQEEGKVEPVADVASITNQQVLTSWNIQKFLKTMKNKEHARYYIKLDKWRETEDIFGKLPLKDDKNDVEVEIKVNSLLKVEDVFNDGTVRKYLVQKGISTSKPDNYSEVFLTLEISTNGQVIYSSGPFLEGEELTKVENVTGRKDMLNFNLNEYYSSKMLFEVLKLMKKGEISVVHISDTSKKIKYGFDYDILQKNNCLDAKNLVYKIKLYAFTEGQHAFTFTVDDKIKHATRKREVALNWLKAGRVKKALKLFDIINDMLSLGVHSAEEKKRFEPIYISSLLNASLCHLKMENYVKMSKPLDTLLKLDPKNVKGRYRKALVYFRQDEFDESLTILKELVTDPAVVGGPMADEIAGLLKEVTDKSNKYKNKSKKVYSKLFD